MELTKNHWTKNDIENFQKYLISQSKGIQKSKWEQKVINTKLPCIAVPSNIVNQIINQISKGNFMEFINFWPWENFANTTILGGLICKIKDFQTKQEYLLKYSQMADNWATIDTIKIKPKKDEVGKYLQFSKKLLKNKQTFTRRLGVVIMLKIIDENTIDEILSSIKNMCAEKEYYVNMALSWLLTECFIKFREKTLQFITSNHKNINTFVINKTISKCKDSFRIGKEDKEMLNKFKVGK